MNVFDGNWVVAVLRTISQMLVKAKIRRQGRRARLRAPQDHANPSTPCKRMDVRCCKLQLRKGVILLGSNRFENVTGQLTKAPSS